MLVKLTIGNVTKRKVAIVDDDKTISEIVKEYMPSENGKLALNGEFLSDDEMHMKLADFNLPEEGNMLISVIKMNLAAKIKVSDDTVKIISDIPLEDMKLHMKMEPDDFYSAQYEGLCDTTVETVRIGIASEGEGSINENGILFDSTPTHSGKAKVSFKLPAGVTNPVAYLTENYHEVLNFLVKSLEEEHQLYKDEFAKRQTDIRNIVEIAEDD